MIGVLVIFSMAAAMVVPLALGVGAGYLLLDGVLEALKVAVVRSQAVAPVVQVDNVVAMPLGREREQQRLAA